MVYLLRLSLLKWFYFFISRDSAKYFYLNVFKNILKTFLKIFEKWIQTEKIKGDEFKFIFAGDTCLLEFESEVLSFRCLYNKDLENCKTLL